MERLPQTLSSTVLQEAQPPPPLSLLEPPPQAFALASPAPQPLASPAPPALEAQAAAPVVAEVVAVVVPPKRKRAKSDSKEAGEPSFKRAQLPKLPRTKTSRAPTAPAADVPPAGAPPPQRRTVTQQSYQGPRRFASPFCNCEVHLATNRGGLFNLSHRIIHQQPGSSCASSRFCLRTQYEAAAADKPQNRVTLYVSAASNLVNLRALFSAEDDIEGVTTRATVEKLSAGAQVQTPTPPPSPARAAPATLPCARLHPVI